MRTESSWIGTIKRFFLGRSRDLHDRHIFHKISLIAFFAWVGLGADGLSSSCYGPQEAFLALRSHTYLSIFVAIATIVTIFVISASYSQIVELFPSGGGGYLVASKLLSPTVGMVSGCALLIDYLLTIAVSLASGADAIFSLLPLEWHQYRLIFAVAAVFLMMILNMRGVKESIFPLVPVFLAFLVTHAFIIVYSWATHLPDFVALASATKADIHSSLSEIGFWGMVFLILKAYSMGAGTFTGLEAVSNGLPILREPREKTAKSTMRYMAFSLSFVVLGLMIGYLLYGVGMQPGKTLNAVFFESATAQWGSNAAYLFVVATLLSEAVLLFTAGQTGFLGGPRVLANMAKDRWFPVRFSSLSDRLVEQNGILIMGILAAVVMMLTRGSVKLLVILYSINVFITFVLSQSGMVRHWWESRSTVKNWRKKLYINGVGLILCSFILVSMIVLKFHEGGWVTLFITVGLVAVAVFVKRHYYSVAKLLHRLNSLVIAAESEEGIMPGAPGGSGGEPQMDPQAKTAVVLVGGFNGLGLHTLFGVIRLFGIYRNFVFLQIGVVDAGNFKGAQEIDNLQAHVKSDLARYVSLMKKNGFYAEGVSELSVDIIDGVAQVTPAILERFPNAVFFGGQIIFPKDTFMLRFMHNYTVFALQKRLYRQGVPFVILPIRV